MPPRNSRASRDDGARSYVVDDSSSSSSDSDVNDFVTVFANRTPAELKAGKPIRYSKKLKEAIVNHAVKYAYAAKAPPTLTVFLDLFLDQLGGRAITNLGSKSILKSCVRSVAGELTTLLCASGTRGLIREQKVGHDEYRVLVSKALIKIVEADELEMSMFKSGYLQELHDEGGHLFHAIVAPRDALPTSTTALARVVVDHLITTGQINPQSSGNRFTGQIRAGTANVQAPTAARYGHATVTLTEADARALAKNRDAQRHAYKNFAKIIVRDLKVAEREGNTPPAKVRSSWKWNHSKIDFDKKKDYVAWQQWFMEELIDSLSDVPNLSASDDEEEPSDDAEGEEDEGSS